MLYPNFHDLVALKYQKLYAPQKKSCAELFGNHSSAFRGQGLEFDSVREYVPGDDIRNIDWRVTARTGTPHLKIFRADRETHSILCVDVNASMRFGTRNTFKSIQAARVAALLGWQALAQNDPVTSCLFGDVPEGIHYFSSKSQSKSFCAMLKMLSEPGTNGHRIPIHEALNSIAKIAHKGSRIYLISDFLDLKGDFSSLRRLQQRCELVFITINDFADKALIPIGNLMVSDEKNKIQIDTGSRSGREAYAELWAKNRAFLHEIVLKYKIALIELTTESDIRRELTLGLRKQ